MNRKCLFLLYLIFSTVFVTLQSTESSPVKDFFDLEAVESYHNHSQVQWCFAMDALSNFSFSPGEKVLDIGCGDGKITACISKLVPEESVFGLDISSQMLTFARETYSSEKYPNLDFVQGDGAHLTYKEDFDTIVSFCCLNWMPEPILAIKGIYQGLKCEGSMLAVVPAREDNDIFACIRDLMSSEKWNYIFEPFLNSQPYHDAKEYAEMLSHAGFIFSEVNTKLVECTFNDEQELKQWLEPIFRPFKNLSIEQKSEFFNDFARAVVIKFPPNSERISVAAACHELRAQKGPLK